MYPVKQQIQPSFRRKIRTRVRDLLRQYVDIGGKVYCSRPSPVWFGELPVLLVYFAEEPNETKDTAPRKQYRALNLNVELLYPDGASYIENETVEDFVDSRFFEIEATLLIDRCLGYEQKEISDEVKAEWDFINDVLLTRTSAASYVYEGNKVVSSQRQVYVIEYEVSPSINNKLIAEFLRFNVDYRTTENAEASDHVTIRES